MFGEGSEKCESVSEIFLVLNIAIDWVYIASFSERATTTSVYSWCEKS